MEKLALFGGPKKIETPKEELFHWPIVTEEDIRAVTDVLRAGSMSGTEITKQFETEYAAWNGVKYALGVCNGTGAIAAAFWACGVGAGDEVICPSITYWASCASVLQLGATVNFADIDPFTLCIDPKDIEHRIGPHTKAILVVNYGGVPADYDAILPIARKHELKVIEDNSHAHGALYKGKMCGSLGDIAGASMMSGKSFAIGEGGMITTDDRVLFERCVAYGHYERTGTPSNYNPVDAQITQDDLIPFRGLPIGAVKHRMNQTCSAMGRVQLKHYPARIAEIDRAMTYFSDAIELLPGLRVARYPKGSGTTNGGWYASHCHYDASKLADVPAERFTEALRAEGVSCYPGCNAPLHTHNYFHQLDFFRQGRPTAIAFGQRDVRQGPGSLPVSENIGRKVISIPWFKHFDIPEIDRYIEAFRKIVSQIQTLR